MLIEVEDLTHIYMSGTNWETKALDQVNLQIKAGEIVGFIGPTGSGKSTLIQLMSGLLKPLSGKIIVGGVTLNQGKGSRNRELRQQLGLVFQFPEEQLFEETVFNDIAFGPRNLGVPENELAERVHWAMETVGLNYTELHGRSPFQLSGGQMRRVAIAGILAMQPRILILDEPTAGLDPQGRDELIKQLRKLWEEHSLTLILVSHHLEELAELTNRIIVMHEGRIVLDGTPGRVFSEVETLQKIGLGVPLVTDLLSRLKEQGWPVSQEAVSEVAAAELIAAIWKQRSGKEK